jgi:hypothetical protein
VTIADAPEVIAPFHPRKWSVDGPDINAEHLTFNWPQNGIRPRVPTPSRAFASETVACGVLSTSRTCQGCETAPATSGLVSLPALTGTVCDARGLIGTTSITVILKTGEYGECGRVVAFAAPS